MSEVFQNTNLTFVINDRQIIIKHKNEAQQAPKGITINGTVRDAQQNPLIGVNVIIKGTTIGTTTDMNGNYFLEVPNQDAILTFSYIGFESQEVKVGGQININVNMEEESNNLEEVVVVGYGSQKKVSVVGSITAIEPEQLQQGTTRAISNNLAGQLAGVIAVQRSGEPGADGSDFWIRGISSFKSSGTKPLVLVDGIERTLDDLSAAEIESFSVLKDAAASAVYGVRGANGVIIVKTKRGQLGKPRVNFHMEQGFTQPTQLPDYIGSADYLSLMDELYMDAGNPNPLYGEELINKYRSGEDWELYPDVNWLDAISKDMASNTRGDLTITGGSDILRYALVASYYGERGIFEERNITYDRTFGKHAVNGMLLYNQRDYNDGSVVPYRRMGLAGRASYTFDNKYIAEFNFGYNGSENFARGNRFGFFPSVALGYFLSEESFMQPYKDTFSKIKLRASWGLTGNDQLDGRRFAYIPTIDEDGSYKWGVNNDFNRSSRFEGEFGVDDLTWETVEKLNVGIELGLWNSLDLQIDWFKEQRRDIFMQRNNIPTAAGFRKTPWANYGKVDNGGVDLSLNYNKQINKDLHVGLRGTFTFARNKIIEQDEALGVMDTNRQRTGHRVNELFGLVAEGLFTEDDFVTNEQGEQVLKEGIPAHTFSTVRPGDIRYKDVDGDGAVTSMDVVALGGTNNPEIVYGFGATARYKNVDFNIFFQGNGRTYRFIGGVVSNFLPGSSQGTMGNIFSNYNDRWTEENPSQDVFYPRLSWGVNANNSQESTWWYRNMSMLRVKDIEIGYTLPKAWMNKIGLSNIRLYAKGSNLFTFSQFDLWNPELDTQNGAKYPIMKSFSVGLDVNF